MPFWPDACRRQRKSARFTLGLAAFLLAPTGAFAAPTLGDAGPDQMDLIVRRQMDLNHISGVAVAIIERGRIIKIASYGDANLE